MKHSTIPTLTAALSALTACGASTASVDEIDLRAPDAAVTEPCGAARALGGEALTQAGVERAWMADRAALRDCRQRHALAVWWIDRVIEDVGGGRAEARERTGPSAGGSGGG